MTYKDWMDQAKEIPLRVLTRRAKALNHVKDMENLYKEWPEFQKEFKWIVDSIKSLSIIQNMELEKRK